MLAIWISRIYLLLLSGMAVYGCLGLVTLWFYWRHRHDRFPCPPVPESALPSVTVQLPVYNERLVLPRLLAAAAALDYPRDRLHIQVLDDSADDTTRLAADLVAHYRHAGIDIDHLRRPQRTGYKAGALAEGLARSDSDLVAVFDADFCPPPDFLLRTVPHFVDRPRLGLVQARWGHLNAAESPLTAAQAIALDKHFAMEQTVRHRADLFPKFNGSGGIWRRATIDAVGGWHDDTICEDLCLSTRAVLDGWECLFLSDVVAPAELPDTITAYRNQQARWAKGSLQCLLKYGGAIARDRGHTPLARLYALLSMSGYFTHALLLALLLLQIPLLLSGARLPANLLAFSIAGIGQPLLFVLGQQVLYRDWPRRLRHLPSMLLIAVGLGASQTRALLQVAWGHVRPATEHPFVRTPKGRGAGAYRLPFDAIVFVDGLLALYAVAAIVVALRLGQFTALVLPATCLAGFLYVTALALAERRRRSAGRDATDAPVGAPLDQVFHGHD